MFTEINSSKLDGSWVLVGLWITEGYLIKVKKSYRYVGILVARIYADVLNALSSEPTIGRLCIIDVQGVVHLIKQSVQLWTNVSQQS